MIKKTLREIAYIAVSGYGPTSQYTLAEWLEARDIFRANQAKALREVDFNVGAKK